MNLIIAYLLDLLIGDPEGYPHPVRIIGKAISYLEGRLRSRAKDNGQLKIAGFILCFLVTVSSFTVTYAILFGASFVSIYLREALEIFIIYTCLATKELGKAANRVYNALIGGDLIQARSALSYIVSRDTHNLDVEDVTRATIETVAENISDGVIAPMFYACIGGAPLAVLYKAANTLDSMVGYTDYRFAEIGYFSAKFDDLLNFIPARITGLLIVVASFVLRYDYKNSWRILLRDRLNHKSPNSAHGEAALAGALGIQLGGLNYYFGKPEVRPKLGDKKVKIKPQHIKDSVKILYISSILGLALFCLLSNAC